MEIDHVAIQVDDIKESIDYYKGYGAKLYIGVERINTHHLI